MLSGNRAEAFLQGSRGSVRLGIGPQLLHHVPRVRPLFCAVSSFFLQTILFSCIDGLSLSRFKEWNLSVGVTVLKAEKNKRTGSFAEGNTVVFFHSTDCMRTNIAMILLLKYLI